LNSVIRISTRWHLSGLVASRLGWQPVESQQGEPQSPDARGTIPPIIEKAKINANILKGLLGFIYGYVPQCGIF